MPNKTIKPSRKKLTSKRSSRPEEVFRVVAKKPVQHKSVKRKKMPRKKLSFKAPLSARTSAVVLAIAISFGIVAVGYGMYRAQLAVKSASESANHIGYSEDAARRMMLIGSTQNYPKEIVNFQSAPEDLQKYAITDYRQLKTSCIVNGNFAGAVRYEIVNVVYDKYARIEKECNGADSLVLIKMSGVWTVVVSGNDLPKCHDVNAFGIPQGISYYCRDGFVTYVNPNP